MTAAKIISACTIVGLVLGIYECHVEHVFWLDCLPAFLTFDQENLARLVKSQARAGTDIYRVRESITTSLYFNEFLTIIFPLLLHLIVKEKRLVPFLVMSAALTACTIVMWMADARFAMVGILAGALLYLLFAAVRYRYQNPRSIIASTVVFAYPVTIMAVELVVQLWHRAHVMVLGGVQHQANPDARVAQWAMGWPKIFSHSFDFGVGRIGRARGYYNLAGEITADNHYMSIMLALGILALPLFLVCFMDPGWLGLYYFGDSRTAEGELLAPLALGWGSFCIVKLILNSKGSVPIASIMAGCIRGLVWQMKRATKGVAASGTEHRRLIMPGYSRGAHQAAGATV